MANTIPASALVQVNPGVLAAGGNALQLLGMMLTTNTRVPIGTVLSFPTSAAVGAYFGLASAEYAEALIYFAGYTNRTAVPAAMLITQYPLTAVSAFLRGGNISGLTLPQLQALTGSLTIVFEGYTRTAASVVLTTATSFSSAAALIQTAINTSLPTEASFTATIGATATASIGGVAGTCTTTGTTLTLGTLTSGSFWPGDVVSGTDATNSLPAGTTIVAQLSGTAGGSAGATFQLSASGTPSNLASFTCTGTSQYLDVTVITGLVSVGDNITGGSIPAGTTVVSQLNGTTGGVGVYLLTCPTQSLASGAVVAHSNVLNVTVCASPTIAAGQTIVGTGVTGTPVITSQISGTTGGVGLYAFNSATQQHASESMTTTATAVAVTYDSVSGGFVITSGATGVASTSSFATGTISAGLLLTSVTGAVLSQGAAATTPSAFMGALINITQNWASFWTAFDPDSGVGNTQKKLFAAWNSTQNNRWVYAAWDTDITPTASNNAASSLGQYCIVNNISGTMPIYEPTNLHLAAFVCGMIASINFSARNGRITLAGKGQTGLPLSVFSGTVAANLIANGYNFYGIYSTANQTFNMFQPGSISGPFSWADTYVNEIQMTNSFQLGLMLGLQQANSIPYNDPGYALSASFCQSTIQASLNFGSIRAGVPLSAAQAEEVNTLAGIQIDNIISTVGYYFQILPAAPGVRQLRQSPPMTFWYADGESVQSFNLSSVVVQ